MSVPVFKSRAEAFDYMLAKLTEQGEDIMKAAEKAEAFAEIIAKNRALPEAPKNFINQCVDVIKQVAEVKKEYPDAWEAVGGILSGVIGIIGGKKAAEIADEKPADPIDFDNLE
jgi:hypothetical protein